MPVESIPSLEGVPLDEGVLYLEKGTSELEQSVQRVKRLLAMTKGELSSVRQELAGMPEPSVDDGEAADIYDRVPPYGADYESPYRQGVPSPDVVVMTLIERTGRGHWQSEDDWVGIKAQHQRPTIGLRVREQRDPSNLSLTHLFVTHVFDNGPAYLAGILVGDQIVQVRAADFRTGATRSLSQIALYKSAFQKFWSQCNVGDIGTVTLLRPPQMRPWEAHLMVQPLSKAEEAFQPHHLPRPSPMPEEDYMDDEDDDGERPDPSPNCRFWEALADVFMFLEPPELTTAAVVCRQFALVVRSVNMDRCRFFLQQMPELRERLTIPPTDIDEYLTRQHILTLRQHLKVPREAQLVGEAVVTLLRPRQNASFAAFRNLIADPEFFSMVRSFDPSAVALLPERALHRLHQRVIDPLFQPDAVAAAVPEAVGLCLWVLSIYSQVPLAQLEMKAIRLENYLHLAEEATHVPPADVTEEDYEDDPNDDDIPFDEDDGSYDAGDLNE